MIDIETTASGLLIRLTELSEEEASAVAADAKLSHDIVLNLRKMPIITETIK